MSMLNGPGPANGEWMSTKFTRDGLRPRDMIEGPRAPAAQHPRDANLVSDRFIGTIAARQLVIGTVRAPDLLLRCSRWFQMP